MKKRILFGFLVVLIFASMLNLVSAQENRAPIFTATPAIPNFVEVGNSHTFKVQVSDPDGDSIAIKWYLDSVLVSTTDEYNFIGISEYVYTFRNISVIISDGQLNNSIEFSVFVSPKAVPPPVGGGGGVGGGGAPAPDQTPPEAIIKFDPKINDLVVIGVDNRDEDVDVSYEEISRRRWWKKQIRTYTLTDDAGNNLILKLRYKKSRNYIHFRILSLKYNDEQEVKLKYNRFYISGFKKFKRLDQNLYVGKQFTIRANYNKKKDETKVTIREDNQRQKYIEEGMVLIELVTDKGSLKYNLEAK